MKFKIGISLILAGFAIGVFGQSNATPGLDIIGGPVPMTLMLVIIGTCIAGWPAERRRGGNKKFAEPETRLRIVSPRPK